MAEPVRIGVLPAAELSRRARLLAALALAYPVRFVAGDAEQLDALIAFGPEAAAAIEDAAIPALALLRDESPEPAAAGPAAITLANDERLARPLHDAALSDAYLPPLEALPGDVLATADGRPIWVRRGERLELAATAPLELEQPEALRDRLAPGRCLALLPLAHLLAALTADTRWRPGRLRAAIVLDDPNLHWPSYGRVRYPALVRHAAAHRYHVSLAMVPLDAWLVHPRVARLFAAASAQVSLCIHGNDHLGPELGRPRSDAEGEALASEALRRMQRFERRAGVPVSRVMVPPHERVSEHAARALRACGYDAICTTRPYPWMVSQLHAPWLTRPPQAGPLAGWHSTDVVAGGLPVLLRSTFGHPREDLVLRAFLGQPLIVYGHHDDLDDELGLLAEVAAEINRLGDIDWCPLAEMARGCVETRLAADTLHVRLRARRVHVDVPPGVRRLSVDLSELGLPADAPLRAAGAAVSACAPASIDVSGPGPVELEAGVRPQLPATLRTPLRRRLRPLARRLASEARDRAVGALPRAATAER